MSRSVRDKRIDYPRPVPAQEPATRPPCEAERRNKQALYEIGRQRTDDAISLHRIERILRGDEPDICDN